MTTTLEINLNPGDIVRLKSGGPKMTVATVAPDGTKNYTIHCLWFLHQSSENGYVWGDPHDGYFKAMALELVTGE